MPLPQNAKAIWTFLTGAGFSDNAAAGIMGNIEQESGGNPMAGSNPPGSGLIQQQGDPGGSLSAELPKIVAYVKTYGSIADVNAHASSPSAAALYFSDRYEKPNAALANNANRQQSANDVLAAAKSGNWQQGASTTAAMGLGGSGGLLSIPSQITDFFSQANSFFTALMWIVQPGSWVRIGAFIAGIALLLLAIHALLAVGEGESLLPKAPTIVPVPV
jgi:hypothetical protein